MPKGPTSFSSHDSHLQWSIVPKVVTKSKGCTFWSCAHFFIFFIYFFGVLLCLLWSPFEKFENWMIDLTCSFASSYLTNGEDVREYSVKSPYLHPVFGYAFTPPIQSLTDWGLQSKEILLNLGMKCWNFAFNAQGSRVSIS